MSRQLCLNLFVHSRGHHEASWRHPEASPLALTDFEFHRELARKAEDAAFDSIFLADSLSMSSEVAHTARSWLEPITLLGALAAATSKIGLIATASTTYTEPFNLVRQFASLDHISNGRIGWNIVTSWSVAAAHNYGDDIQVSHAERYARAEEYMAVAKALWDSWADDAVLDDRPAGRYARRGSIHALDHAGEHYKVAGPLNVPRCPQGRPVFVQAGSSETGRDFAARHAEVVFTAQMEKATAQAFYADLKARAAGAGRDPDRVAILPGFSPLIADTQEEAERLVLELNGLADPEVGRKRLSGRFGGFDFGHLDLDRALTAADFPDPDTVQAARSRAATIVGLVERERPTLRQLLAKLAGARGHYTFAGTPEQTADFMEEWLADGAADGFNLMPPVLPWMLDAFIERVLPILRGEGPVPRGLFRRHAPLALRPRQAGARNRGGFPTDLAWISSPGHGLRRVRPEARGALA